MALSLPFSSSLPAQLAGVQPPGGQQDQAPIVLTPPQMQEQLLSTQGSTHAADGRGALPDVEDVMQVIRFKEIELNDHVRIDD